MTDWAYTLSDDTAGTVEADDLDAAGAAIADIADGRTVLLVQRLEIPEPTVVRSVSGADVVLDVNGDGTVSATPVALDSPQEG